MCVSLSIVEVSLSHTDEREIGIYELIVGRCWLTVRTDIAELHASITSILVVLILDVLAVRTRENESAVIICSVSNGCNSLETGNVCATEEDVAELALNATALAPAV